jgi:general secretion pathway protein D
MRHAIAVVILASFLASVRQVRAQPVAHNERPPPAESVPGEDEALYSCKQRTGQVVVTFKTDAEIKDLIAWVMGFTCKNFLLDPRVVATGRKISLLTPNKMTAADAYRVFLAAMATVGLTVVPRGNVMRVVEAPAARKEALPIMKQGMPDDVDQVVRYVYKPSYIGVEPLHQAWVAIKSEAGDVFTLGSVLVMTDYASHVREMLSFAKLVDVPGGSDGIYTIPVLHADATKLTEKINGILNLPLGGGAPPRATAGEPAKPEAAAVPSKLVVDERTNTLIVAASDAGYQRVKALVERLDIALEIEGGSSIHVYPLGSAIAEELAKTLTSAISDGRGARAGTSGPPATTPAPPPAPPGPPAPPAAGSPLDTLGAAIEGQVRVIADPPTNALIVMSSGRDFLAIKDVIRQLDLPRRQVYIEAMIVEVDLGNDTTLGTVSHGLSGGVPGDGNNAILLGGVETKDFNSTSILSSLGGAAGLFAGLVSPQTVLGQNIPSFAMLFRALAEQSNANIISSPSIIAVDNVEAKYKVGTTIQVSSGTTIVGVTAGASPAGIGNSHVGPEELPLILNIKPHISNDNLVMLEVKHEAKELTGETALGPTWNTRSFETRVVVGDQQTIVLGGLSQDKETVEATKVPLLGDIPLLGYLFKTTVKRRHKTNLLVMLTPYIIRDQLDLRAIRERKLREHDELARSVSTLDHMKYEPRIDYGRKRGVVEEINRSVQDVEHDIAARGAVARPRGVEAGSVELHPPAGS